jgi:hypothetical protein
MLETIRGTIAKLASRMARRGESDFVCGDCERWERCGLPPSKDCIVRAAQIARNRGRLPRRIPLALG